MLENFERLNGVLDNIENILTNMKAENDALKEEIADLRGKLDDKELEIMQLQEDAEKTAAANKAEKYEIEKCLNGLLGRMNKLSGSENGSEQDN